MCVRAKKQPQPHIQVILWTVLVKLRWSVRHAALSLSPSLFVATHRLETVRSARCDCGSFLRSEPDQARPRSGEVCPPPPLNTCPCWLRSSAPSAVRERLFDARIVIIVLVFISCAVESGTAASEAVKCAVKIMREKKTEEALFFSSVFFFF